MASLQEQLLKAGLTTKQKARQANSESRKKNKQKRSGVQHEASLQEKVKQDLAKAAAEKIAKDTALNAEKQKAIQAKELHQRILQILTHHQLKNTQGDHSYNYTFNNKVKTLHVNDLTQKSLINGRLALCGLDEKTYVVTGETATKLAELDASVVLLQNDKSVKDAVDEEDPYAAYQIPDDLMW